MSYNNIYFSDSQHLFSYSLLSFYSKPDILNSSRKKRIADGAGSTIQKVNSLLKKYKKTRKMMGKIGRMDENSLQNMMNEMNGAGRNNLPRF